MSIRTKILGALLGMALLVALMGMLAVNRQRAAALAGVLKEAEGVAKVMCVLFSTDGSALPPAYLQEIVTKLHKLQGRDIVLVDAHRVILADAVREEVGETFTEDKGGEVEATLRDRQPRTFVEVSEAYPEGIKQIVLAVVGNSGRVTGAVIIEYTPLYNEVLKATEYTIREVTFAGIASVILALLVAVYIGRSVARPLEQLTRAATGFAAGETAVPMPSARNDEIGKLSAAFTDMMERRQQNEKDLRAMRDNLETRVNERTAELGEVNETLRQQQAELRVLFDLMPAMIWFKDVNNNILRVNKRVADAAGKSVEEIEGRSSVELYPKDAERFYADDLEVIRSGVAKLGFVETMLDQNGRDLWVQTDKVPVQDSNGKIIGIIVMAQDITERMKAEESLQLLSAAVAQSKESILITDARLDLPGPAILFANPSFAKMTGYSTAEVIGKTPRILQGPKTDRAVLSRLRQSLERGEAFEGEAINYRKDGTEFHLEWQIAPIRDAAGATSHFVAIQRDVTERKRLEGLLYQSQKMETIGKLAGGIAHEFNSILTAIIGQSDLILGDLPAGSPLVKNTAEITKAAERAAVLTRQLLAYSRKQFLRPEALDLNAILAGMSDMLRHLVNGNVQIIAGKDLRAVKADAGQIEQVIMNIVNNAREAMPNGGRLTLETGNVSFDEESVHRYPELKAGDYVMLAITDTGAGIAPEIKARVFEPFFSTKGVGQGTGLGLSTCYGIVKQSGGHISVYSEAGRGATFKIYLPQVERQAAVLPMARLASAALPRGTETILLAEDDPALREMAATLLRRLGYTVLEAAHGVEALTLKQQPEVGHIDLLFTDVVMPHMSGKELADRVRALYPHTKILFTSAYTESAIIHQGVLDKDVVLLQKPFTPSALARKIREVLDQSSPSPASQASASSFP